MTHNTFQFSLSDEENGDKSVSEFESKSKYLEDEYENERNEDDETCTPTTPTSFYNLAKQHMISSSPPIAIPNAITKNKIK